MGGDDTITGDATLGGLYHLEQGGNDTVTGGSGNDGFYFGAAVTANDHVNGGAGSNDQIGLEGDYSGGLTMGATTISGVEVIACLPGFSYNLTTVDANVATGDTLTIWAVRLASSNTLIFNGSAELDGGKFTVFGGAGNDSITGGSGADTFYGLGGADTLTGNGGADRFVYTAAGESTGKAAGTAYDTIVGFDAAVDQFDLPGTVTGLDATVGIGALSSASFDSGLAAAVGAGQLVAGHAVLFTPDSGTLNAHTFHGRRCQWRGGLPIGRRLRRRRDRRRLRGFDDKQLCLKNRPASLARQMLRARWYKCWYGHCDLKICFNRPVAWLV